MPFGTIKKWMPLRGGGTITPDDNRKDVFVSKAALQHGVECLDAGDVVHYEMVWHNNMGINICTCCIACGDDDGVAMARKVARAQAVRLEEDREHG